MLFDWRLSFTTCVLFFITLPSIFSTNFEFCSEGGFVVVERYISRLIVVETIIIIVVVIVGDVVVIVVVSIVMVGKKVFFDAAELKLGVISERGVGAELICAETTVV